jgi:hypothetical protein
VPLERKRRLKGEGFGLTRWGPESLGVANLVPVRNARTDAHVWANEQAATGHPWPFSRTEWEVHAQRLGLMPAQVEEGWRYIGQVWARKQESRSSRDNVVAELRQAVGKLSEISAQYGGSYVPAPHALTVKTKEMRGQVSWPWRTKSAERVFKAATRLHDRNPAIGPDDLLDRAYREAVVSSYDLTPEDDALMGIALYWLYSKLTPQDEPPPVAMQQNAYGMKGTQSALGGSVATRGAP